jgi:ATP-dependent Clp protease ATP-binding subunit ClpB
MKQEVLGVLRQQFRPEFLNRIDDIVVFHSLSREDLTHIVDIQLERLRARLQERRIELELTAAAKQHLALIGYDPSYGARPLKRAIQRELETPLGRALLRGDIKDGQKVIADLDQATGGLKFTAVAAAPERAREDGGAQASAA